MKVFRGTIEAVNQNTGLIETFDWKPVAAESLEDAKRVAPPYVKLEEQGEDATDWEKTVKAMIPKNNAPLQ